MMKREIRLKNAYDIMLKHTYEMRIQEMFDIVNEEREYEQ